MGAIWDGIVRIIWMIDAAFRSMFWKVTGIYIPDSYSGYRLVFVMSLLALVGFFLARLIRPRA